MPGCSLLRKHLELNMNSNLTPEEQWRAHGAFTPETANELLDLHAAAKGLNVGWMQGALEEVRGCIPKEDFLATILRDVALLVKRSRGGTQDAAQEIFNDLHALMERQRSDTDHAIDQIDQVQQALAGLKSLEH